MKILITTDWYVPAINGVVTSVRNLKRGLEKRGHEVRILTLRQEGEEPGENEEASRKREPDVWRLRSVSAGRIYPKARVICGFGRRQREEILDWQPDVIHSQCEFSTFLPARMLARQLGVRWYILTIRCTRITPTIFLPARGWGGAWCRRSRERSQARRRRSSPPHRRWRSCWRDTECLPGCTQCPQGWIWKNFGTRFRRGGF